MSIQARANYREYRRVERMVLQMEEGRYSESSAKYWREDFTEHLFRISTIIGGLKGFLPFGEYVERVSNLQDRIIKLIDQNLQRNRSQ